MKHPSRRIPGSPPEARASFPALRGALSAGCAVGLALVVLLAIAAGLGVASYNGLVGGQETVAQRWAEVDNQYKRRYDLIPQLVETVKGAANFEQETLTAVTEARASVGRVSLPENLPKDQAQLDQYVNAQQSLGASLGRLLVVSESYPELRATEAFRSLQDQLEGTENRIGVARNDYTVAVRDFNTRVRTFPRNLIAGMFGFAELPQFKTDPAQSEAPKIDFGND